MTYPTDQHIDVNTLTINEVLAEVVRQLVEINQALIVIADAIGEHQ